MTNKNNISKDKDSTEKNQGTAITTQPTYGLQPVLTVAEVAAFLRINKKSVYAAVSDGTIPANRVGRRVVILRDVLLTSLLPK